jgi:peptidoglycan/xylan/chitin deacetylase (PgdA/CDA1 family)
MDRARRFARRGASAVRRRVRGPRPAVLMYHRIASEPVDPWSLAVSPARFEEQVEWLVRRRTVLPLPAFVARLGAGDLPRDAVALTFDDGYACNAVVAAPVLEHHRAPATFFLATDPIGRGDEYWWDDLERIVHQADDQQLVLDLDGRSSVVALGPRPAHARWAPGAPPSSPRQEAYLGLWRTLRPLPDDDRRRAVDGLRRQASVPRRPRGTHRPMTVDEARALARSDVVAIGAHTATHPPLSELSRERQVEEIERGLASCRSWGAEPTTFAYPYGDLDDVTVDVVRQLGFVAACTTEPTATPPGCDPHRLPRLQVGDWTAERLRRELRDAP